MLVAEIDRVDKVDCGQGVEEFTVTAITPTTAHQFQTFSPWLASYCQIAHDKQLRVELTYHDRVLSRFGRRWKPRLAGITVLPRVAKGAHHADVA